MNINNTLSTTQTFGILNVRSMGDRTISSLPTDVNDDTEQQPPGLTECSFSSSESSESSNYDNSKEEIVVSLVEDKAVVTCGDEGYEIIPTTTKSTNTNSDDKVHQTTTKITPPSSNKNMNNNPTIEVEHLLTSSTSTPPASTSPPTDSDNTVENPTNNNSKRVAETSIYATLSSASESIRTRQISIATQPTSNAALSNSGGSNVVDIENIEGVNISTTDLKSTTDVDTLASNNNKVLDNELTISNSKAQSKLSRVQSDTVSEYYQWYEDNVR